MAVPGPVFAGIIIAFGVLFIFLCNFAMGIYQRRFMKGRKLLQSVALCAMISIVTILLVDNLFLANSYHASEVALTLGSLYALMTVTRPIVCTLYEKLVPKRRLALIGSNAMAERVRLAVSSGSPSEAVLVAHYDCDMAQGRAAFDEVLTKARANGNIDAIYVEMAAPDLQKYQTASGGLQVSSTLLLFDRYVHWTDLEMIDIVQAETVVARRRSTFRLKRMIEISVSLIVVAFFLPLIIGAMIAIKIEDGGSLFYRQTRVGKDGKLFSILKFRSMIENAEKVGAPQWATIGDSRVTRVGNFLRKSRIDELPQLLNVIKGDMALVGPRPERPEFEETLSRDIANFDLRHVVRPGLTGWAQISYPYGASLQDAHWKTRYDLYYIFNWSIWFDIAIIFQTIRVVLLAEGSR